MDTIDLGGLTFYGYHGAFAEEQRLGQRFVVRLRLGVDLAPAGRTDDLSHTVNYAAVAETVRGIVEGPPFRLIEALGAAIADAILGQFDLVEEVRVRVEKPSAPISAAPTAHVAICIDRRRGAEPLGAAATGDAVRGTGSVLAAGGIRALLTGDPPLVSPLTDEAVQVQPNGIDLTLESVWRLRGAGTLGTNNDQRVLPERELVAPSPEGSYRLPVGTYMVRFLEAVALPLDVMAFGRPRSSLLRCGAALHTAVWDAGYQGRSESLMVVYTPEGIILGVGARLLQLVFVRLETSTHAYSGVYQGENMQPT